MLISHVGGNKVIDVIDVARQADSKMKLSQFIKYFMAPHRPKVLNLISLEFSDTRSATLPSSHQASASVVSD